MAIACSFLHPHAPKLIIYLSVRKRSQSIHCTNVKATRWQETLHEHLIAAADATAVVVCLHRPHSEGTDQSHEKAQQSAEHNSTCHAVLLGDWIEDGVAAVIPSCTVAV